MRLIYAIAFAVFFVAVPMSSPAQALDLPLLSAQCTDDYYEDADGQCDALSAGEVLTIEAILARYGIIITGRTDDEIIALYLDDLDDMPVGSIGLGTKTQFQPTTTLPTSSWIQSLLGSSSLTRPPKQVARPRTILRPPVLAPRASR